MLRSRAQDGILIGGREAGQLVGHRGADLTAGKSLLRRLGKACNEGPAFHDPFLFVPQKFCNARGGQSIFLEQRANDAGLVERVQCAPGLIRLEQKTLVLRRCSGGFDDDGDHVPPISKP